MKFDIMLPERLVYSMNECHIAVFIRCHGSNRYIKCRCLRATNIMQVYIVSFYIFIYGFYSDRYWCYNIFFEMEPDTFCYIFQTTRIRRMFSRFWQQKAINISLPINLSWLYSFKFKVWTAFVVWPVTNCLSGRGKITSKLYMGIGYANKEMHSSIYR